MLKLGALQTLEIIKKVEFGVYLAESKDAPKTEQVLLPAKQVPKDAQVGDKICVFLYKDSSDRAIATTREPLIKVGEIAELAVLSTTKIGAFLDWGLEKDLLLPFREQTTQVQTGCTYPVALYIDKSERLCATMKLYDYLETRAPYVEDDVVEGVVYDVNKKYGLFIAIDGKYSALVPGKENFGNYGVGDRVHGRVTQVREDGKLNVSLREKAYLQMDVDAMQIMKEIDKRGGKLPFTDKADPELIKREMHMSKAAFKRAVGRLLKGDKIEITSDSIVSRL